jgi:ligand-binding sensor domain-containing protein
MFITSCKGQTKELLNSNEARIIKVGFPKLVKTQHSNQADNVHCGIQDKNGNLWFGTTGDGVYRFDGKLFTNYTTKDGLSSNAIWSILEDKEGNIWFGTRRTGLYKFDGNTFTSFSE